LAHPHGAVARRDSRWRVLSWLREHGATKALALTAAVAAAGAMEATPAEAYQTGPGSITLQLLILGLAAALVAVKIFWPAITRFARRVAKREDRTR
jgi:hypothetical protein